MGSPDEKESKDDKTLDEHSKREEWSESSESADLHDASDVRILCTKEYSNNKIKENFCWHKREPPAVDSTFQGKAFPDPPLTEIPPCMYFKQFFDDELIKHIADLNLIKTIINYLKYNQLSTLSLINASQYGKKKCSQ